MLKVLLVDDELNVIKLLKEIVNWAELGYEIHGEALDGQEALRHLERSNDGAGPDLVIADINMPNLNGLELAATARRIRPATKVILLTGFNEFNYARQAVNIGVSYFLLKPVDQVELAEVLGKLRRQLEQERAASRDLEDLRSRAGLSQRALREGFCRDLLSGKLQQTQTGLGEEMKRLQIMLAGDRFQVLVVEIDHFQEYPENDQADFKNALWETIAAIMSETGNYISVFINEQRLALIIGESAAPSRRAGFMVLGETIRLTVADSGRLTVTIGCGASHQGLDRIHHSYYEAVNALNYKFILGNNRVIHYQSMDIAYNYNLRCTPSQRNEILLLLRIGNSAQLIATITAILNQINEKTAREQVQLFCMELVAICLEFMNENALSIKDLYGRITNPWEELRQKEILADAKDWVIEFYQRAIRQVLKNKTPESKRMLEKTIQYIETNLSNRELTVHGIAQIMHINEDYLSSLFKKEFGMPLIKYLNQVRLQRAKEIMDQGGCNLTMIAAKVGFEDQNYFSKCFKKHYGISPSRYLEGK